MAKRDKEREAPGDILGLGNIAAGGGTDLDKGVHPHSGAHHTRVEDVNPLSDTMPTRTEGGATSVDMGSGGEGTDLDRD